MSSMSGQKANSTTLAAAAAVTVVSMLAIPYWFLHRTPSKKLRMGVPIVQTSMWACLCNFLAPDGPEWLLKVSKDLQSSIFLLSGRYLALVGDRCTKGHRSFIAIVDQGPRWRRGRKSVVQGFTDQEQIVQITTEEIDKWIQNHLLHMVDNESTSLDTFQEMQHLTISVISRVGFDYDLTREESTDITNGFKWMMQEYFKNSLQNPFRILLGNYCEGNVKASKGRDAIFSILEKMLQDHRDKKARGCQVPGTCIDGLDVDDHSSDGYCLADMFFLLFAGFETTSAAVAFALFELAKNQELQTKIQREIQNVSPKDATNNPWIGGIIKEALRLYPATPNGVPRKLGKEFKFGSMTVPKNSTVTMAPYIAQRNGEVFDNPDTFDPSRWFNATDAMKNSYYPFYIGRRNCAGMRLAEVELHIVVLKLLQRYRFSVKQGGIPSCVFTYFPKDLLLNVHAL